MELHLLPQELAVLHLSPTEVVPEWVWTSSFFSVTRTEDELSIFCNADVVPEGAHVVRGWRTFRVAGELDHELFGILSALALPLAEAEISIFSISTHDTDYMVIPEHRLEDAMKVLEGQGHSFV